MENIQAPKPPMISKDAVDDFFQLAAETYKSAPWKYCSDADVFGVLIPETKELHFVSVMGGGGQCFGLATYRGIDGLDFFLSVIGGSGDMDPFTARRKQNGLLMEFTSKKYLDDFNLEMAELVHFKPANSKSWVMVKDMEPGWFPWAPKEKDISALTTIMSLLPTFTKKQKADPEWTLGDGEDLFPIFIWNEKAADWKIEWWDQDKILEASNETVTEISAKPVDELKLQKAKSHKKSEKAVWEAYSFYMPEPVLEGERPFFPEICVIMDHKANQCMAMEMIPPTQDRAMVLRDLAIKTINKTGQTPQTIIIEEMGLLLGMITLKEALEIDIKFDSTECGYSFRDGLYKKMDSFPR
ncbi:MAG: DUF7309 domain-containing protein [Pseudobdellovibrionaceae bacterium]